MVWIELKPKEIKYLINALTELNEYTSYTDNLAGKLQDSLIIKEVKKHA